MTAELKYGDHGTTPELIRGLYSPHVLTNGYIDLPPNIYMDDDMGACKLAKLGTEFTPERITLHIELVPPDGETFDAPMTEPGKKLGMIANYARGIFQVNLRRREVQKT